MTASAAGATALRVLTQLRRDPRTIALILGVPCLLETLLRELFNGRPEVFQHVGAPLLGLFPFVSMFVVTSVTMLRELSGMYSVAGLPSAAGSSPAKSW